MEDKNLDVISRHSRDEERVLFFADDEFLLASSDCDLLHGSLLDNDGSLPWDGSRKKALQFHVFLSCRHELWVVDPLQGVWAQP